MTEKWLKSHTILQKLARIPTNWTIIHPQNDVKANMEMSALCGIVNGSPMNKRVTFMRRWSRFWPLPHTKSKSTVWHVCDVLSTKKRRDILS